MTREEAAKILYQEKSSAGWMRWVGFPIDIKKEQDYKRFILAVDVALDALCGPDPDTGCPECSWIDPALSDCNYCKNCGRRLRDALIERTEVEG